MKWEQRQHWNNTWKILIGEYYCLYLILDENRNTQTWTCYVCFRRNLICDAIYSKSVELHSPKTKENCNKYIKKITHSCLQYIKKQEYRNRRKFDYDLEDAIKMDCSININRNS